MTPQQLRRTVLHIDGLRYSFSMARLAGRRLRASLDEAAGRYFAKQDTEEQVTSALLDAWSIIDMCHRARELVQQMPGLSQRLPMIQIFLRGTEQIEKLRHHVQHFRSGIPSVPTESTPLWGGIAWIPTHARDTCIMIFTGNFVEGLGVPSIAYDTHRLRFASDIVLYAGGAQADLLDVVARMMSLREGILEWITKHPNFTRADRNTFIYHATINIGRAPED